MNLSKHFFRFCLVGIFGLAVDLVVLYTLAPLSNWYFARSISFFGAASTTWLLNRKFTFNSDISDPMDSRNTTSSFQEYRNYLIAMLIGGSVNYLIYILTLKNFIVPYAAAAGVAMGSVAGLAINFSLIRWVVFRRKKSDSSLLL